MSTASDVRLSIVVATCGRPTLGTALASATSQMRPGDELVVVFDDSGDAGDTPRNRVLDDLHGTHILFLDDDDVYRPGALAAVRRFAAEHPGQIGIFRFSAGDWGVAWREDEEKRLIATATAMYVVPNVPGRIGRFGRSPGTLDGRLGDYRFIVETVALQGDPIWREEILQELNAQQSALARLRYALKLRSRIKRLVGISMPTVRPPVRAYPEAERWAIERHAELTGTLARDRDDLTKVGDHDGG